MRLRGPVTYEEYKQRVRRFRQSDVLRGVASANVYLGRAKQGLEEPLGRGSLIHSFLLDGIARTALVAGNEFRDPHVLTRADLERLCLSLHNVEEPPDDAPEDAAHLRQMLARIAYEQFGAQLSLMEQLGRSIVLFEGKVGFGLPSANEWRATFGASVRDLIQVGFAAYGMAMAHDGHVPVALMEDDEFCQLYDDLDPMQALGVLDSFFSAPLAHAVDRARRDQREGYEKWSPSPLLATPVVVMPEGVRLVPSPRMVLDRVSPGGLFYPAIEAFGSGFAEALGRAFEAYVGDQLRLLQHAVVTEERTFRDGGHEKKTCDWFVVTDECVVLVEVKGTRPKLDVRLGTADGFTDILRKVGKAADQLEATAAMVRSGHSDVADIPSDRPLLGLIVTLEPFHLTDAFFYDDVLDGRTLPIAVSYAHEVEGAAAILAPRTDVGQRLCEAFSPPKDEFGLILPPRLQYAIEGLEQIRNPILDKAWERLGVTWSGP